MKILEIAAISVVLSASFGAYVLMTRPSIQKINYNRSDVLSLKYFTLAAPARAQNSKNLTSLSLEMNLIISDTANIRYICKYSQKIMKDVYKKISNNPIALSNNHTTNIEEFNPNFLKSIRNTLKPYKVVDLDYGLKFKSKVIAAPKYSASKVECAKLGTRARLR